MCAPTVYWGMPALLYLARALLGLNCGISIGIGSMYVTELSPRAVRGAVGACVQLAITLGILLSYVATLTHTLNTPTLWPMAVALNAAPALLSLVTLPFCPQSPRFLYLTKNRPEEAKAAFRRVNSKDDVDQFIGELCAEVEASKNQPEFKFTQLFTQADLRMPVLIACLIQIVQQLSGINAVGFACPRSSDQVTRAIT